MGSTKLSVRGTDIDKLPDKQRLFIAEYVKDYNSTRAAKAAGYKHPHVIGRRLIDGKSYPKVSRAIGKIQNENLEMLKMEKDDILRELAYSAMRDPIDLCDEEGVMTLDDLRKLPERIRRTIESIECYQTYNEEGDVVGQRIKLKLTPKLQALEMAMKHFGMYETQKHEVTHTINWDALYDGVEVEDIIEGRLASE